MYVIVRKQSDTLRHQVDSDSRQPLSGIIPIILPDAMLSQIPGEYVDELHHQIYGYFSKYERILEEEYCKVYQSNTIVSNISKKTEQIQTPAREQSTANQSLVNTVVDRYQYPPPSSVANWRVQPSHQYTPIAVTDDELKSFHTNRIYKNTHGRDNMYANEDNDVSTLVNNEYEMAHNTTKSKVLNSVTAPITGSLGSSGVSEPGADTSVAREFLTRYVNKLNHSQNNRITVVNDTPRREWTETHHDKDVHTPKKQIPTTVGHRYMSTEQKSWESISEKVSKDYLSPISKLTPGGELTVPNTPYTEINNRSKSPAVLMA